MAGRGRNRLLKEYFITSYNDGKIQQSMRKELFIMLFLGSDQDKVSKFSLFYRQMSIKFVE
jgi:hypothetical protein